MTPAHLTDTEFEADMAAGAKQLELRDLAFEIADSLARLDVETWHYTVVSEGQEWRDLRMQSNAELAERCARALRYLDLRGHLVRNSAFPNLVRVEVPDEEQKNADD